MSDKKLLQQAIAREEKLLSRLDEARVQALSRINDFKRELVLLETTCTESQSPYPATTPLEKVKLFRSLFRGREDVFPKLSGQVEPERKAILQPAPMIGWPENAERRESHRSNTVSAPTVTSFR